MVPSSKQLQRHSYIASFLSFLWRPLIIFKDVIHSPSTRHSDWFRHYSLSPGLPPFSLLLFLNLIKKERSICSYQHSTSLIGHNSTCHKRNGGPFRDHQKCPRVEATRWLLKKKTKKQKNKWPWTIPLHKIAPIQINFSIGILKINNW